MTDAHNIPAIAVPPSTTPLAIGVCYTPREVVDYIVEQTVGRLVAGKTPQQIRTLRILDPACGEGVFLSGAYQYLLTWYRDRYLELRPNCEISAPNLMPLKLAAEEEWQLTLAERWRILRDHLYGVDISAEAVSITQKQLLQQCFAPEATTWQRAIANSSELQNFGDLTGDLTANLKCGNAIIDQVLDFDLNQSVDSTSQPCQWQTEFPGIMEAGGFDLVIGNPPYVDSEWMAEHLPTWRRYCAQHYQTATGNWDLFCIFIEKAFDLCKPGGLTSFVVPNRLSSAPYAATVRRLLTQQNHLLSLRDYSRVPLFPAAVYPIVYVAQKQAPNLRSPVQYERMNITAQGTIACTAAQTLDYQRYFSQPDKPWILSGSLRGADLCDRLQTQFPTLASMATVLGAATVAEAYQIQALIAETTQPTTTDLKVINSGTIDRYRALWGQKVLRYLGQSYQHPVIPASGHDGLPPKRQQQARQPKIIVAGMTQMLECVIDLEGAFLAGKSTVILLTTTNLHYLLALLNSRLLTFYYRSLFGGNCLKGGYLRIGPAQLRSLPICPPPCPVTELTNNPLVALVQQMLSLQKRLCKTSVAAQRQKIQRQIQKLDAQIDQFIYDLYGLSAEEKQMMQEQIF